MKRDDLRSLFGGIFRVLIPDNTNAIIIAADSLARRITPAFLEYGQARHLHIDPARVRHARDNLLHTDIWQHFGNNSAQTPGETGE